MKDIVGLLNNFLDGGVAHRAFVVGIHFAKVNVHPEEVAAFPRDQQDAATGTGLDGALGADIREVGDGESIHDAQA